MRWVGEIQLFNIVLFMLYFKFLLQIKCLCKFQFSCLSTCPQSYFASPCPRRLAASPGISSRGRASLGWWMEMEETRCGVQQQWWHAGWMSITSSSSPGASTTSGLHYKQVKIITVVVLTAFSLLFDVQIYRGEHVKMIGTHHHAEVLTNIRWWSFWWKTMNWF